MAFVDVIRQNTGTNRARRQADEWETNSEVLRTRFRNAKDPQIGKWAERVIEQAGGIQNARIIACVPVENPKTWDLNTAIAEKMEEQLVARGVPQTQVRIIVQPMDFTMLAGFVTDENWQEIQKRLTYATDEQGRALLGSKLIDHESARALEKADGIEAFKAALVKLGETAVFFPKMGEDEVVTWLYDEMRKAVIQTARKSLGIGTLAMGEISAPVAPQPQKIIPRPEKQEIPRLEIVPVRTKPPYIMTSWVDISVDYRAGLPLYKNPGSIYSPPISVTGRENAMEAVNTVYNLNHLLGAFVPLWNPTQPQKDLERLRAKDMGGFFDEVYPDGLRAIPASYASRVMRRLFDVGAQIKIGKLVDEHEKLYVFSSIPGLPIRGDLPLMDGVAFSFYSCVMVGAAWTREWVLQKGTKDQWSAQTDLRAGAILSNRSLLGAPSSENGKPIYAASQKQAAIGVKLLDNFRTNDALPDTLPLGMLDARLIYTREMNDKVSLKGSLTLNGVGAAIQGGLPSALLEGETDLRNILNTAFISMNGGVRVGWNVEAMRMEELSANLTFKPKDGNLPILSVGASETWPLKGDLYNVWGKLEESLRLDKRNSIGAYAKGAATLYPYGGMNSQAGRATNLEFGISWKGIIDTTPQEE